MQIGGGLGDEYMRAPSLNLGGGGEKGKGGFFANLLDLLGIHKQVAKDPKGEAGKSGKIPGEKAVAKGHNPVGKVSATGGAPGFTPMMGAPTSPGSAPPPPGLTVLDEADAAFSAIRPRASQFGFSILPRTLR